MKRIPCKMKVKPVVKTLTKSPMDIDEKLTVDIMELH